MHVKKGDMVVVISGKDKGKKGKVLQVFPKKQRVIVEGVNMQTKHKKATPQVQQGGRIHQEGTIHVSNVMPWSDKLKQGVRVGYKKLNNGEKVRIGRKSGQEVEID